ncbi:MAG: FUN14 domain-containing protein [Trueperaceae bacterium]|nr:MAG: FUN14 domain-containing protein [Trueperaceae bacterium]
MPTIEVIAPYLEQVSFGALAGFAAGYALKKLGKLVAVALGLLFIFIQLLAYYGFVTINWIEVQRRIDPLLESQSLGRAWGWVVAVLTHNVTFAAAFVPGFLLGLRRG